MENWRGIFSIQTDEEFNHWALKIFQFQFENTLVYREYCELIRSTKPRHWEEIPFLPISFFKSHAVKHQKEEVKFVFKSSGTTGMDRSQHFIQKPNLYTESFRLTYTHQMGDPANQVILALLPSYLEQGESSLVFMVDDLIQRTKNALSGFLLGELETVESRYNQAIQSGKEVVIFGVSYALLDLAEKGLDLSKATVVETGGMKGRRKEMTKEELHSVLSQGLRCKSISSEYGMTELLSQAYSKENQFFTLPSWMRVQLRETNDPFAKLKKNKTGGINVVDLANVYSCSFIATQDLGRLEEGKLKLMGRFDHADVRGCNLLVQ